MKIIKYMLFFVLTCLLADVCASERYEMDNSIITNEYYPTLYAYLNPMHIKAFNQSNSGEKIDFLKQLKETSYAQKCNNPEDSAAMQNELTTLNNILFTKILDESGLA